MAGKDLKDTDLVGKLDPFLVIKCGGEERTGQVMTDAGTNPVFNQTFTFDCNGSDDALHIDAMDQDLGFNDHIGHCDIPLSTLLARLGSSVSYSIYNEQKLHTGELMIRCQSFVDANAVGAAPRAAVSGQLSLLVVAGKNLKDTDLIGAIDPYVVVRCGDEEFNGEVMHNAGTNPTFNQMFTFNVNGSDDSIHIDLMEQDLGFSDHVGHCDIAVSALARRIGQLTPYPLFNAERTKVGELLVQAESFGPAVAGRTSAGRVLESKSSAPAFVPVAVPAAAAAVVVAPAPVRKSAGAIPVGKVTIVVQSGVSLKDMDLVGTCI